jgi:hypothetical protein
MRRGDTERRRMRKRRRPRRGMVSPMIIRRSPATQNQKCERNTRNERKKCERSTRKERDFYLFHVRNL